MSVVKLAATQRALPPATTHEADIEQRRREAARRLRMIQYGLAGLGTAAALYGAAKGLKSLRDAHLLRAELERQRSSLPRGMHPESGVISKLIHKGRLKTSKKYRERVKNIQAFLEQAPKEIESKRFSGLLHGGLAAGGAALALRYAPAAPSEEEV